MARKKMKLAFISNDMARKISYNKRKKNIIKKVSELATLCGIEACAVISSPFDSQPEIWPDVEGAKRVVERFKNTPVKMQNLALNQVSFMTQMISKQKGKQNKMHREIHEMELKRDVFNYLKDKALPEGLTTARLNDISMHIEKKMKEINDELAKRN